MFNCISAEHELVRGFRTLGVEHMCRTSAGTEKTKHNADNDWILSAVWSVLVLVSLGVFLTRYRG